MIDLNFLLENPSIAKNITLHINGEALIKFAEKLTEDTAKKVEQRIKAENKPDKLLTRYEVGQKLGVALTTLWHWEKKGVLCPIRIGKKVRYRSSDIEKALNS